jgi:predicted GNAT superfamily acetyltransferase
MLQIVALDSHSDRWRTELDSLYQQLGGGQNPHLLPYHFLQAAFPHIGGVAVRVQDGEQVVAGAFALPYNSDPTSTDHRLAYVIRHHPALSAAMAMDWSLLHPQFAQLLATEQLLFYDPAAPHPYAPTHQTVGVLDIGRPDAYEAATIRDQQQHIWGSPPEFLYPVDLHSNDFPLGTSLVARVDGAVAGFLFGFYKRGGPALPDQWGSHANRELRIESQLMGVLPAHRGLRLGYLLKKIQAEQALAQGINIIHWTVDPLQYANAALNFGLLRAVAFTFTPDYYPFRNALNRGPASRLSLTWLLDTNRVRRVPLFDAQSVVVSLATQPSIVRVNDGWQRIDLTAAAPQIAIEIPANWTKLQQTHPDDALHWRAATDQLLGHYLGSDPGHYVITDVGVDGEERFLIAQRADDALWTQLTEE